MKNSFAALENEMDENLNSQNEYEHFFFASSFASFDSLLFQHIGKVYEGSPLKVKEMRPK